MNNYETEAIVIGSVNFGDTDKIVTLFTKSHGKVRASAFGARRPKSPLAAPLQMFHVVEANLSEGYSLDTLKQASIKKRYKKFGEDLETFAYGMFVAEILCEVFGEKQAEPEVFELAIKIFDCFEKRNPRVTAVAAAWQLLFKAGFSLSADVCPICEKKISVNADAYRVSVKEGGFLCENHEDINDYIEISDGAKKLTEDFLKLDFENPSVSVKGSCLIEVEKVLLKFLQNILGYNPKSLKFIREL
ncbi:MAG: DNA repair protein RecO [Selenomonadaceae bacterium]|nr:DNA repair protein RecO [Selenomonadaceae bacterium]